ncbi:DMT family transporter [Deinococcus lacus]|uniref:DMT family transporter n=1 Tax=Deinococcus lacus TaxID=392561 RepID=A0ABW1YAA0_9DEIO
MVGGRLGQRLTGGLAVTVGMLIAAAVSLPAALLTAGTRLLDPEILGLGLGVAVLSSAVPYTLEMQVMRVLPPQTFGVLMSLEPAVAALAGVVILSEALQPVQWLAVACIIAASVGMALTGRSAHS